MPPGCLYGATCTTRAPGRGRPPRPCSGAARLRSFTLLLDGTVLVAGGTACNGDGCVFRMARRSCTSLPACRCLRCRLPEPAPDRLPEPDPAPPTPLPPAAGPVPPNARVWTVTVDNRSSEPATLFVAEEDGGPARRVGDPERGPSRRHREGDLPLPCRWWMDLREPAPGRRRRVGQRGPDRHPRQDPDPSGRRGGSGVEPVAGKHRAERLRRLACAGHALRVSRTSCRSRMVADRCCHRGAPGPARGRLTRAGRPALVLRGHLAAT